MARFHMLHPPHHLDPSSDFLRDPPDLAGFDNFCKEYLLVQHRQYVVVRSKGRYDLHGAWRVVFRCLGHTLCARGQGMEYEAVLRDGCVFFGERSDRTHMGDMKHSMCQISSRRELAHTQTCYPVLPATYASSAFFLDKKLNTCIMH